MTNKQLANEIEKQWKRTDKAHNKAMALALHSHEKPSEVRARIGSHPAIEAWDAEIAKANALYDEAARKYGPNCVMWASQWPSFLRNV